MKRKNKRRETVLFVIALLLLVAVLLSITYVAARIYYPLRYGEFVDRYSEQYGLPRSLVYAVIHTESRFDPNARSSAEAIGLMQITSDTLDWIAAKNGESVTDAAVMLQDPETNIKFGCMLLSAHLSEFSDTACALAAYNAGRGRVLSWLGDNSISADGATLDSVPYPETDAYIKSVLKTQSIYKLLYFQEDMS